MLNFKITLFTFSLDRHINPQIFFLVVYCFRTGRGSSKMSSLSQLSHHVSSAGSNGY